MDFSIISDAVEWLHESHPIWLVLALVLLPLLPFPVSPLLVLAGIKFGVVGAILTSFCALALNFSLAYYLCQWPGRPLAVWLLGLFKLKIPAIPVEDEKRWIVAIRLTPGIPLLVENFALGLARVSFLPYLGLSLLVHMFYAVALIIFGAALFSGRSGWAVTGVLFSISLLLILKLATRRLRGRQLVEGNPG